MFQESSANDEIDGNEFITELNIIMTDRKKKINFFKAVSFDNQYGQMVSLYAGDANFNLALDFDHEV